MITQKSLQEKFHIETGMMFENHEREYYEWLEENYLNYLNDQEKFNNLFLNDVMDE